MADEKGSPDTLVLTLTKNSPDYKPGEVVWTRGDYYRIEEILRGSQDGPKMHLLRLDLTVTPIVQFDNDVVRVQTSKPTPKAVREI